MPRDILQAPDLQTAQFLLDRFSTVWKDFEPRLVEWAESNIPEGFNVLNLPKPLHKKLRTSNLIERMNQELILSGNPYGNIKVRKQTLTHVKASSNLFCCTRVY